MKKTLAMAIALLCTFSSSAQLCPDDNHPHMIDLGLPSGLKWACCNMGAEKPEDHGGYYAWGETEVKLAYNDVTYLYSTGLDWDGDGWYNRDGEYQDFPSDIMGSQYDVAHVKWGGPWVMPSYPQSTELLENCTSVWTTRNGVDGVELTGKNGASIFLPAAGYYKGDKLLFYGVVCYYWLSTLAPPFNAFDIYIESYEGGIFTGLYSTNRRYYGFMVRPVMNETDNIAHPRTTDDGSIHAVYNIYGVKVADSIDDLDNLKPGIYIYNGKKIVTQ